MLLNPVQFHSPTSLSEASKLFATLEEVKILAGGTFVLNSLKTLKKKGAKTPRHILSLRKVRDLKGVVAEPHQLTVKAMTIINDLYDDPAVPEDLRILRLVCKNISTNPIRNMATFGGNLTCRYTWTEMGAVMIALDAKLHFLGSDGVTETVSAEDFFKNAARADKLFTHATIARDPGSIIAYQRVKKTLHVDVPLLAVCIKTSIKNGRFTDTRVAVNTCVAFAQRDYQLEDFLNSSSVSASLPDEALTHMTSAIYDNRSTDYKKHMYRVSIKRALQDIVEGKKI